MSGFKFNPLNDSRQESEAVSRRNQAADPPYDGYGYVQNPSGRQTLEEIIDLVVRRRWIIIFSFLAVVASVGCYVFFFGEETLYRAQSFIMLDLRGSQRQSPASEESLPVQGENLFSENDRALIDELFVLENSRSLAQQVARRLREIEVVPGSNRPLPVLVTEEGQPLTVEQVAGRLRFYVDLEPVPGSSNIVAVLSTSTEPSEAVLLSNLYSEEYVQLTRSSRHAHLSTSKDFFEDQLEQRREDLRQAEERLKSYMPEEGTTGGLDQEGMYLVSSIAELEAQREEARLEQVMRRTAMESLEQDLENIEAGVATQIASGLEQKIQLVREKTAELQASREDVERSYPNVEERDTAVSEQLSRYDQQIQQLQEASESLAQQYVDSGGSDLSTVVDLRRQVTLERRAIDEQGARISLLEDRLERYRAQVQKMPARAMELAQLERSRMYAERMHQYITERLLNAQLASEFEQGASYVSVVREAEGAWPVPGNHSRSLLLGALFGLFLGIGLAFVRDKLDNRIFKPDQLRERGYSEVGVIPDMTPLIQDDYRGKSFVDLDGRRIATSLVTLLSPTSSVAEAYRRLRTTLHFNMPDTAAQILLVTSPGIGEGKSVTAANLAVLLARTGRRTLLLDTDLRRPQVHQIFGLQQDPGLVQILLDGATFNGERMGTGIDDLFVVTAGRTGQSGSNAHGKDDVLVVNTDELIGSKRMHDFLAKLRDEFDCIVIDTPPVLAATDAVLLAPECDATLLVARAGKTKEGELQHAAEMLVDTRANVIGVLLNGFNLSMAYGYNYRYSNYLAYGSYSK